MYCACFQIHKSARLYHQQLKCDAGFINLHQNLEQHSPPLLDHPRVRKPKRLSELTHRPDPHAPHPGFRVLRLDFSFPAGLGARCCLRQGGVIGRRAERDVDVFVGRRRGETFGVYELCGVTRGFPT